MSVRRTVAQSSAGLLLLAAFAAGPAVAFGDAPATPPGPGASDGGCSRDASGEYQTTLNVTPATVEQGKSVTLEVQCFRGPIQGAANVVVIAPDGSDTKLDSISAAPGGSGSVAFQVPEDAQPSENYAFKIEINGWEDNRSFTVIERPEDPDPGEPRPPAGGDDDQDAEEPGSDDDGQEQDGGDQNSDDNGVADGDSGNGGDSGTNESGNGSGSNTENEQNQDSDNNGESDEADSTEGSGAQPDGDTNASGTPTNSLPGDEQDGDTNASSGENAAARKPAPQQPPAAPGSATNDFPAAQQEATADQKQSAALAVLMTKLFAGGVSSGSVGTTPDQARTVIDPSADASEIEVPAGSDNGGSSDDGSGSESSDGDALAATGSNMLVPAGIAAAAILLGAGLKIHQIRRGR